MLDPMRLLMLLRRADPECTKLIPVFATAADFRALATLSTLLRKLMSLEQI